MSSLALLVGFFPATAQQNPPLERTINLSFTGERVEEVLKKISSESGFVFSYNPSIFDGGRSVTIQLKGKTVREALNDLFAGEIQYKEKGNYIILTKAPPPPPKIDDKRRMIRGYVTDDVTMQKIAAASVYEKSTLTSVITNSFGYYEIRIERSGEPITLTFSKRAFQDTSVTLSTDSDVFVNIAMSREPMVIQPPRDNGLQPHAPVASKEIVTPVESLPTKESEANIANIRDTLYNNFQVSLLPFVGTNHRLSGNVVNDYSLNILGGYNLGVRKLEIGGIFNIVRGNVSGVQAAGVFNVVGGKTRGVQLAGTINLNRGVVKGWQFSGVVNANLSQMEGPQFAGVINVNGSEARGVQFAGVGNFQIRDLQGSQFAGVLNMASHHISGVQVAPVLNYARTIRGVQIGLVNVSDSIKGVPIGLLSLVGKGYHKIELATDESLFAHLSFRTGVHAFYNILTVGIRPDTFGDPLWMMGYGLGTSPRLSRWLYLNFDVTSSHVSKGHLYEGLSFLHKAYLGFDFQLTPKLSISLGATLNGYYTDRAEQPPDLSGVVPEFVYDEDVGNTQHLQMWWGGRFGVRFL